MKNPEFNTLNAEDLVARLKQHPIILARMESLLNLIDNADGDVVTADAAEFRTIDELRQMGSEVLHGWANTNSEKATIAAMDNIKVKKNA
jgi:hypothetical protein